MAVDAVASLVLQKLRDFLSDESFPTNKVISHQLKQMQKALEKKRGFLVDAAEKEANVDKITEWTNDYIHLLYSVEDSIELFAVRITRQRKRWGFVMDHALFLIKFTGLKMLIKLLRAQRKIKKLNSRTPSSLEDASLRGRSINSASGSVQPIDEDGDAGKDYDDDTKEDNSLDPETDSLGLLYVRRINSTPAVSKREGSPREILSGYSFKMRSCIHASLIREHWLQSELMYSESNNEEEGSPRRLLWEHSYSCNDEKRNLRSIRSDYSFGERWQQAKLMYSYSFNGKEPSIIGYKSKTTELMNRLDNRDDHDRIISVVGELGSGKTLLARAVYGDRIIKKRFKQACALANIFQESSTTDILLNLLRQVKNSKEEDGIITEDSLKCKLSQALKDQKYLIVLDDVQSSDQWESLKDAFPDEKNGSKIILTTRRKQLAVLADSKMQPHIMGKLDPMESWALFKKKAGLKSDPEGYLKERIIEVCQDIPLNIVMLGSLLSTKQDRRQWTDILYSPGDWQTSEIVMMSYNDLDAHLKLCLLYMMLFPKELDIPVRRLQRLWLAEGFVKQPQNEEEFQEDVAQEYFDNLVRRSLIMVTKLRSDGSPRRCRLLGVLHGLLLAQARDINLFHVHLGPDCQLEGSLGKRRLIEYADAGNCPLEHSEIGRLRSYISFNLQKKDTPARNVSSLVSKMVGKGLGLLRVLDLEGVYKPSLPENLGDLFHLRYLGLRWTFLDKLPKSVGELPYLETLDLKHTRIDKIPTAIWKLKNLRHLNLDEVHLDKDTVLHLRRSLPKLLTLWGLSVSHESPIKNGLSKLKHLRELGISFRLINCSHNNTDEPTKALVEWISELTALRSLRLRSKDDCGHPADLSLKPFSGLTKLSHMKLLGKLQQLPLVEHFPPHIKVLTLSLSYLSEDPMPILGKLPDLTVLRLLGNSYTGEPMVCKSGTFKNLEVLKLWMLENLKKWEVEDGAMEKLKEVNIRRCSKLEKFPDRLLKQETFKELILNNMPPAFKENIDKKYQLKVSTKDFEEI
ncbi:hypothetical protein C2S52_000308 [Perilla frutescens var. hirtella]|nr:hypothetical protein C2S52_000308 [Perilla frutescens var. hirtella]